MSEGPSVSPREREGPQVSVREGRRPEVAVGAVVVRDDELLMVRRGRDPGAGRWSLPGGRVEAGETLATAVEREVREETGLAVRCGAFVGFVERIGPGHHYVILDFAAAPVGANTAPDPGDDAEAVRWVPRAEVRSLALVDGLEEFLRRHGVLGDDGKAEG